MSLKTAEKNLFMMALPIGLHISDAFILLQRYVPNEAMVTYIIISISKICQTT